MKTHFILPLLFSSIAVAQPAGGFTGTGNMITPRFRHTATLLHNGKVLILGGVTVCVIGFPPCLRAAEAELYDPVTGAFAATGNMTTANPTVPVLLPDGRVLLTGSDSTGTLAMVELFDPSTGNFNVAGNPAALKTVSSPTLLPDGRVLLTGIDTAGARSIVELFDPSTGNFNVVGSPRTLTAVSSRTLLPDGRVLLTGTSVPLVNGAELYDPVAATFDPVADWPAQIGSPVDMLIDGRVLFDSGGLYDPATGTFSLTDILAKFLDSFDGPPLWTRLLSDTVLFTGGNAEGNLNRAFLYDPATGTIAATGSMSAARNGHSANLLPDGTVLVAGGAGQSGSRQPALASAELYDLSTGRFSATGSLTSARYYHTSTLLKSGQVLITGGTATAGGSQTSLGDTLSAVSSAEIYTPAVLAPVPKAQEQR